VTAPGDSSNLGAKCIVCQNRNFLVVSFLSSQNKRLSAKNEKIMLFMEDIWLSFSQIGFILLNFMQGRELERGNIKLLTTDL
jgi:hypothetical protein